MWTMLPLSPWAATKLTGLVLLLRFPYAAVLGSALGAPFSQLITEPQALSSQLLAHLRREKDERCLLTESLGTFLGRQQQWLLLPPLPLDEILAELAVSGARIPFYRDLFVLLTSCAGFRRPPRLPWQQFLLKYRWECKLILNKVKWRRGWKKLSQSIWSHTVCLISFVRKLLSSFRVHKKKKGSSGPVSSDCPC